MTGPTVDWKDDVLWDRRTHDRHNYYCANQKWWWYNQKQKEVSSTPELCLKELSSKHMKNTLSIMSTIKN